MSTEEARKLFVAGLPDSINEDVLRQLFEATGGTVVDVSLPKDRATGRPRGFGFVTLASSEQATAARDSLDGSIQAGKTISVRPFQAEPPRRGERGPNSNRNDRNNASDRTLYVGNLPFDTSQEEVEGMFASASVGPVVRVSLPTDEDGRKRGFGFVTMGSAEAANSAVEALHGTLMKGRPLRVNLAHPKGERPPRRDDGGGGGYSGPRSGRGGGYGGGGGGGGGGRFEPNYPPPMPPPSGGRPSRHERRRNNSSRGNDYDSGGGGRRGGGGSSKWDQRERGGGRSRYQVDRFDYDD